MLKLHGARYAKRPMNSWALNKPPNGVFIYAKSFRVCPATMLEFGWCPFLSHRRTPGEGR
jgi:hypothetical protein